MKRFISSLRVEIPCGPPAQTQESLAYLSNGNHLESLDGNGKEEKRRTEVEDLDVIRDVQYAENSTKWSEKEGRMGCTCTIFSARFLVFFNIPSGCLTESCELFLCCSLFLS